ncbi:MAG: formate C-acetyltransferase [Candidatus Ratteibacteria bacterium]|nr:formate C-acetyltransferase [Candidatus Ratteibacteria bacterium]
MKSNPWRKFKGKSWQSEIDIRGFIQNNYMPYTSDCSFLKGPTERTQNLKERVEKLFALEKKRGGVLAIDTKTVSSLLTYKPGYVDKKNEIIVGLQTDSPLKRGVNPFGGIKMVRKSCEAYGYKLDKKIENYFSFRTTHNDGVFRAYTEEMKKARKNGVITGLPDAYGRGRIIGDYRRVPLYGVDFLIEKKQTDKKNLGEKLMNEENIRLLEELYRQMDFLGQLKKMAKMYGFDISKPASNSLEATQWLYFAYLGAIKEQNGAAMSLGRIGTFLDIYFERDIKEGRLTEEDVQEIIDDFVLKLRLARHLRTPEYNELFAGDPSWITESLGGMGTDGRTLVTKSSYRFLNTLYNLGSSPEPNLTVLWSKKLPENFKRFCAKASIDTNSLQYENDDIMRPLYGDDYGIACCVSAMKLGKQMQYFGARCNLPKVLLMALNGGRDELTGEQIGPQINIYKTKKLNYKEVMRRYNFYQKWLCNLYVNTMNVIHFMHDKYAYEKLEMALHDTKVERFMAFGIAGLSVIADSISAIKYADVKPIYCKNGLIVDFKVKGDFPKYGNDDDRVDSLATKIVTDFYNELKKTRSYRNSKHTLSILTITSNVVYGKKTGATPDGRQKGEPFAPGANPMHKRDLSGALASLNSVSKIPYRCCRDGISNTFSILPSVIGKSEAEQVDNIVTMLDGYFLKQGHHLNVNVLNREHLIDAMKNPDKYPNLTIRVSGYAVNFHKLNREQQKEVISRTFHSKI